MPIVNPTSANNVTLYGYIRNTTGTAQQNVQVLVTPGDPIEQRHVNQDNAGEAYLTDVREVLTDADGLWQIELRRGISVTIEIPRLDLKVTANAPTLGAHPLTQDFVLWAYQPKMAGSRQFVADPVGAPGTVQTTVLVEVLSENLPDVLDLFDQIRIYRATTRNGVYAEVTSVGPPDTRLVLIDGQTFYEFTETIAAGSWYRADFFDSANNRSSPLSPPMNATAPDYALVSTIDELRRHYLFGLSLTDDRGNPFPDSMFEHYLRAAISWFERELDISLRPAARVERQDYYYRDFQQWGYIQLDRYPAVAITSVEYMLAGSSVFSVPGNWILAELERGVVQIVPTQGDLGAIFLGASAQYIGPLISQVDRYPGYLRITYSHGFALGTLPREWIHAISMQASIGILNIAGDLLVGAGIATLSTSIDGASQSIGTTSSATNAGFGARILNYAKSLKELMPRIRAYHKGVVGLVA